MEVEVLRRREWLCVFIPVLGVVRDKATHHGGDGTIESLGLAVSLRVVRRRERFRHPKNTAGVLVELALELEAIFRQNFLFRAVLEDPVRCKCFRDVEAGGALEWDDLLELGKSMVH